MTQAHRLLLKWARHLHVYLTLFGFVILLFFAVTGFMLNHENWFLPTQTTTGKMPTELLGHPVDREGILDTLRSDFGVPQDMPMESFDAVESANTFRIAFQSKSGRAEAVIRRGDGETVVTLDTDSQSRERINIVEGQMPMELLIPDDTAKALPIVEKLRRDFGARGEVNVPPTFEKESESFSVVFKAPTYQAKATIRASDGYTKVVHQSRGFNGVLLDLHRGKESGVPWSILIDGVSILFVFISTTGLILWSSLRSRAQYGIAVLVVGAALSVAVYFVWVPS
jgi:uncharacterized protein